MPAKITSSKGRVSHFGGRGFCVPCRKQAVDRSRRDRDWSNFHL
ncbi:hypothetical protein GCWU000325_00534 [Alloprevotella tannerae ATCC 51259]|uniref:Uncharacterized protein n=1 Tax=Alloprevotella tannerae ATCC 51259 TaxID=626522 RepID=C9LEA8_9BACT|nr:hypothetical protein GCWU000325_00726 [Alloprevotella tannerae ATCC 51259]EEX72591.1 hypothetical protein GCWU000325_00534 [Alloprevotella tannerae ATCC 51259]